MKEKIKKTLFYAIKFSACKISNKVLGGKTPLFCENFILQKKSSSLMKIERNQGCFFKKSDFILRKARLEISKSGIEISKSRIEKIKSRFFLEKINEKIEKINEKIAKNKDFFGVFKA